MESKHEINIKRSTAIALLARLGLSDIPYALPKQCGDDLSRYLSNIILNNTDENYETIIIEIDDLKKQVNDFENAIKILNYYAID